jgi:hypothetical protein
MALAPKGFDPLASLFDAPERRPQQAVSNVCSFEDDDTSPSLHPDSTDDDFDVEEPSLVDIEIDKVALARALARAALARAAGAPKPNPPAPPAPLPEPGLAPAPTRPEDPSLRLLARARRPTSAQEAMAEAKRREQRATTRARERRASQLPREVRRILKRQAPGATIQVVNALVMDERTKLRALWKAHRSRLSALGQLHQVVATSNVIRALTAVGPGQLVAAVVKTESSEYLVWVDMGSQVIVAAFENGRTWIAG